MSTHDLTRRGAALACLQEQIRSCQACELAGYLPEARPIRDGGRVTNRVMVVGQAPGARSDAARRHFSGPAGALLEQWFERASFPPDYFRQQVYLTSLTRCFPGKQPGAKGDRVPSAAELALCRPFLDQELALVRPALIVAVGTLAVRLFLGNVKLAEVVGTLQSFRETPVLPLPHSSPVSRWLNDPANRALVETGLARLAECRTRLRL